MGLTFFFKFSSYQPPKSPNRSGKSTPTKGRGRDDESEIDEEEERLKKEQLEKERLEKEVIKLTLLLLPDAMGEMQHFSFSEKIDFQ